MSASAARTATDAAAPPLPSRRPVAPHEFIPTGVLYAPVAVQWAWLAIRHRGITLPCLANPRIPTGGLCGESKTAILDAIEGPARDTIAPYARLEAGPAALAAARAAMRRLDLAYPVIVKPDIGCRGAGVRLVADETRLAATLDAYPAGTGLVLQYFVPWEGEAGITYSRAPGERHGRVLGVALKSAPSVVGDGRRTLRALVIDHPRAGRVPEIYLPRLEADPAVDLDGVPPSGARVRLVFTGNHSKGSVFREAGHLATPALEAAIDAVLGALPDFHHGRVDLRFRTEAAFREGRDFKVIEVNGIGAEPIGMWDPDRTPAETVRLLMSYWHAAFRIGAAMRGRGHRAPTIPSIVRAWRHQERMIATYPPHD